MIAEVCINWHNVQYSLFSKVDEAELEKADQHIALLEKLLNSENFWQIQRRYYAKIINKYS